MIVINTVQTVIPAPNWGPMIRVPTICSTITAAPAMKIASRSRIRAQRASPAPSGAVDAGVEMVSAMLSGRENSR